MFAKIYRGDADFDFARAWPRVLVFSAVLVALSLGSFYVRGLNLGIDFEGGGLWDVPDETSSVAEVRDALRSSGKQDAKIQVVTGSEGRRIRVQADLEELGSEADVVTDALAEQAGVDPAEISVSTVGPTWGEEITRRTITSLIWFFVLIAAYIAWRLEWKMAVGALAAVVHDIILTVGVYSIFQFEVTPATVIAFLTIMGYSMYDTIVVYDKVRVNEAKLGSRGKLTYSDLMSTSMNQVLMRSINTTFTSILPVLSMLVVGSFILGAATLQEFSIALLVGLLVGGYSSIFVAAPVVVALKEREPRYRQAKIRARERRAADAGPLAPADADTMAEVIPPAAGVIQPRSRKKGRKR